MLVEIVDPNRLRRVVGQALRRRELAESHPNLPSGSERARKRREAYRKPGCTYVGNVHLGPQDSNPYRADWSFQESAPVGLPNPEPNVIYGDHVLGNGDYLTMYDNRGTVLWEGLLEFYPDGMGYRHPLGVDEPYLLGLFIDGCPAELRTPTLVTVGETVRVNNAVFGGAQVREPVFKA